MELTKNEESILYEGMGTIHLSRGVASMEAVDAVHPL